MTAMQQCPAWWRDGFRLLGGGSWR